MKKKLLAGILALALCSANILPQTVFAEEFTSGNPEEVSEEETPEVFTDENQESAGETEEELSVFSEGTSEFEDNNNETNKPNEEPQIVDVDLTSNSITGNVYTITSGDTAYRFTSDGKETSNRITISDSITTAKPICIYLKNVNIKTSEGPALRIPANLNADVHIYLEGENILETSNRDSAALQKENTSELIINNVPNSAGSLIAAAINTDTSTETGVQKILAWGAGIGGGANQKGSNITINGGSITASSTVGAGIGGGGYTGGNGEKISINGGTITAKAGTGAGIGGGELCHGSNITIKNGFVTADSAIGAGIGGGANGYGKDITIENGSITADSSFGAGIGGGYLKNGNNIIISNSLVSASSDRGDSIGGGDESETSSNITISSGSVKAAKLGCQPKNGSNQEVYRCTIENPEKAEVTIKTKTGQEWQWNPVNHSSLDPDDTNLYVWLPKPEDASENSYYTITLKPETSSGFRTRNYSFDTDTKTFKTWQAVNDFDFKSPENTTYDGKPKEASLEFKFKPTLENDRKISLIYYKGNYSDINDNTQPLNTLPVNAYGYLEDAYKMLLADTCPSWLYEVKAGATTMWERWDALREDGSCNLGEDNGSGGMVSFNHYANGAVGDFFYRRILGIEATEGGYKTFRIAPQPGGGLSWAKGNVNTPYGRIRVSWTIENDRFKLKIEVPAGTRCEIILPSGRKVTEGSGSYSYEELLG